MSIDESSSLFALLLKNAIDNAKPLMVASDDGRSVNLVSAWKPIKKLDTEHYGEHRDSAEKRV